MDFSFAGLISSKVRVKLIMRLFFNPEARSYLRELAKEFGVSTNAVREELSQLTKTNLLTSNKSGRQVYYMANKLHPLFPELKSMVGKVMGIDQVIESVISRLGSVRKAFLIDDYAQGKDTGIIDVVLVGDIDHHHLRDLTAKTERYIKRKIRTLTLTDEEFRDSKDLVLSRPSILIWDATATHETHDK
jgi:hypothetical protein